MFWIIFFVFLQGTVPDSVYLQIKTSLQSGEREKGLQIAQNYLRGDSNPRDWEDVARFLRSGGAREEYYSLLEEGRKRLKDAHLFGHDFYLKYWQERNYEKALPELVNILRKEGSLSWVRREASRLERYLGDKKSKEILKKLTREKPPEHKIYLLLVDIYIREGNFEKAADNLKNAGEESGLMSLALEALKAGEPKTSSLILDKIKEKDRNAQWFLLKGNALYEIGDYERAKKTLEVAVKEGNKEAKEKLLDILMTKLKNPEEVLELTKDDTLNIYRLKAYLALGNLEEAKKLATLGARKNPELAFSKAYLEMLRGDISQADSSFKVFISRFPSSRLVNDALFYLEMSSLLQGTSGEKVIGIERFLAMQKPSMAEKKAREFLRENPEGALSLYARLLLADALLALGKAGEALGVLENLKEGKQDFIVAKGLLKAYFIAKDSIRDPVKAQNILETLILKFPNSPYADVARSLM